MVHCTNEMLDTGKKEYLSKRYEQEHKQRTNPMSGNENENTCRAQKDHNELLGKVYLYNIIRAVLQLLYTNIKCSSVPT